MKHTRPFIRYCLILVGFAIVVVAAPVRTESQTMTPQAQTPQTQTMAPPDRGDVTRRELANMDHFMDSHPEIAEQLRKDPSLVNNKEFVENHPALQQFLAEHPGVREEYKENPNAFMHQEERFDRREDSSVRRDHDVTGGELASFNEFMGNHDKIADELSKNPSLANNKEYLENHPALRDYLKAHPEVHEELTENPETFIKSAQQFGPHGAPKVAGQSKPK